MKGTQTPLGKLVEMHDLAVSEIQTRSTILPERFHKLCTDLKTYRTIDLLEIAALASAMNFRGSANFDASLAALEKQSLKNASKKMGKFVRGAGEFEQNDSASDAA
jgi:hypothetical protein